MQIEDSLRETEKRVDELSSQLDAARVCAARDAARIASLEKELADSRAETERALWSAVEAAERT